MNRKLNEFKIKKINNDPVSTNQKTHNNYLANQRKIDWYMLKCEYSGIQATSPEIPICQKRNILYTTSILSYEKDVKRGAKCNWN